VRDGNTFNLEAEEEGNIFWNGGREKGSGKFRRLIEVSLRERGNSGIGQATNRRPHQRLTKKNRREKKNYLLNDRFNKVAKTWGDFH